MDEQKLISDAMKLMARKRWHHVICQACRKSIPRDKAVEMSPSRFRCASCAAKLEKSRA